jgi:hypothetical protein
LRSWPAVGAGAAKGAKRAAGHSSSFHNVKDRVEETMSHGEQDATVIDASQNSSEFSDTALDSDQNTIYLQGCDSDKELTE